ncbi:DNA cytosine methyltransferase [Stenotrophomonas sp. Sa5BUN4]|uniref:DNA (cytosine-5-)-methyltransferase n=1 Tax=Stenotrophomonas lacuserhaii TaxID=2760084 RepID=A0A8X8FLP5_9GAMM|nr:DNA cytosine methyltransferase [Stenotrophomonas pennii]MBD7952672.1 DNA cytosine methyltransferase [Stenotrophomonas pennii]
MAEGFRSFNFPLPQRSRLRPGEIVVDLFAGGGGASEGLKQALGIDPALAYNHDELAIGMHAANHPLTQHHREDIWHADPRVDVAGRPIGWFHASPDCTHFSQAKGGQPRSRRTRALSWVVKKWIGMLRRADLLNGTNTAPRIFSMENVWQMLTWGPLVAKRCKSTGRVVKMDGTIAARGERVPVENQQLVPDKRHSGRTWRQLVAALRAEGYVVEWRKLVASDYGAGTSRERLFVLGRRDGEAIVWPAATHGVATGLQRRVSAADCLDFSIPCRSIFARPRPLADATMRRVAKGVMRHVLQAADPFVVPMPSASADNAAAAAAFIAEHANASNQRTMAADEPLRTVCASVKGGHFSVVTPILAGVGGRAGQSEPRSGADPLYTMTAKADTALVAPSLVKFRGDSIGHSVTDPVPTITSGAGAKRPAGAAHALGIAAPVMVQAAHGEGRPGGVQRWGAGSKDVREPVGTVTASGSGGHAVACAFVEQANGGFYQGAGNDARDPVSTITASGSQQRLATAHLLTMRRNAHGQDAVAPLGTVCASTVHHGVVECTLSAEQIEGAERVAAFLVKYYGSGIAVGLAEPLDTVTTKDRLALVTVVIKGTPYVIVDIGLRMLKPHELYRAQGFPVGYIIDRTANGTPLNTSAAVRMVGNSVSPPPLRALAEANLDPAEADLRIAA